MASQVGIFSFTAGSLLGAAPMAGWDSGPPRQAGRGYEPDEAAMHKEDKSDSMRLLDTILFKTSFLEIPLSRFSRLPDWWYQLPRNHY